MKTEHNLTNENVAKEFKKAASNGAVKLKHTLLKRVGLASHELRIGLLSDSPFMIENYSTDASFKQCEFYYRYIDSTPFYLLNVSNTVPAVTSIGMIATLAENSPIRFRDPRLPDESSGLQMSWHHNFITGSNSKVIEERKIPTLPQGCYLSIPEKQFHSSIWWLDVIKEYGWHEWVDEKDIPEDTGIQMRKHIAAISKHLDIWLYVILDNDELLPFKWDSVENIYTPGFWTDGTMVP